MMGEGQTAEARGGKHAEKFTPSCGVLIHFLEIPQFRELLKGLDKTILDPFCGQGQYGCTALVLKMFYCLLELPPDERPDAVLRILLSLYHMDIQEKSCRKAREHLLLTVQDAYKWFFGEDFPMMMEAAIIINNRVQCGNSLEFILDQVPPENRVKQLGFNSEKEYRRYIQVWVERGKKGKLGVTQEWADAHLAAMDKQNNLF